MQKVRIYVRHEFADTVTLPIVPRKGDTVYASDSEYKVLGCALKDGSQIVRVDCDKIK